MHYEGNSAYIRLMTLNYTYIHIRFIRFSTFQWTRRGSGRLCHGDVMKYSSFASHSTPVSFGRVDYGHSRNYT